MKCNGYGTVGRTTKAGQKPLYALTVCANGQAH
jgi:hypothetical protein